MLNRIHYNDLYYHPHRNRTYTEIPNGSQDLSEREYENKKISTKLHNSKRTRKIKMKNEPPKLGALKLHAENEVNLLREQLEHFLLVIPVALNLFSFFPGDYSL